MHRLAAASALLLSQLAFAQSYLQCTDLAALERGPDALAEIVGNATCRRSNVRGVDTLHCEGLARPAFGLTTSEISASAEIAGTRRLTLVFRAGSERVLAAVERALPVEFEVDSSGWFAIAIDDVRRRFRITTRDDGATLLACELTGAANKALGGAIEGRLRYEKAARVRTRVCAIPVDTALPLACLEMPPRLKQFRIDGLPAAQYFVAAYPLEDNALGMVAAYAKSLRDCRDQSGCVAALVTPINVKAGSTTAGVDIEQRFADVPERVRRVRLGR